LFARASSRASPLPQLTELCMRTRSTVGGGLLPMAGDAVLLTAAHQLFRHILANLELANRRTVYFVRAIGQA